MKKRRIYGSRKEHHLLFIDLSFLDPFNQLIEAIRLGPKTEI